VDLVVVEELLLMLEEVMELDLEMKVVIHHQKETREELVQVTLQVDRAEPLERELTQAEDVMDQD
jgi:hypothetical protein